MNLLLFFILFTGSAIYLAESANNVLMVNEFAKIIFLDEKYMKIKVFKFYKKTRNLAAMNITYETLVDIISDDQVKIIIKGFQFKDNEFKKTVVDFSIGICTLYRANKFDTTSVIKYSNIKGCPFKKGEYYLNDVAPTADLLPPFFPEGKWMADLTFTYYGNPMIHLQWMFSVRKNM